MPPTMDHCSARPVAANRAKSMTRTAALSATAQPEAIEPECKAVAGLATDHHLWLMVDSVKAGCRSVRWSSDDAFTHS